MQITLKDVSIRGAGVAWKGETVALGVKFQAPFTPIAANELGLYDGLYNGNGTPRKFLSQQTGIVVPDAQVTVIQHPDLQPWHFIGKFGGVSIVNQKDGLHIIFRVTVDVAQPIMKYVENQKKEPALEMTIAGLTQSSLDFDSEDIEPEATVQPKKRGRPRKK